MNRNRLIMIGIVAVVLAGVVTAGFYRFVRSRLAAATPVSTTAVVVAATDLAVGSKLQDSQLQMKQVTSGELPDGVYHSKAELIGRGVVIPMVRNEMVLANKVAVEGVGAGLSSRIPQGMRAVSLRVNDVVSVAGFVKPGTRVDVLLTGTPKGGGDVMVTTTVLENVEVLTTGQEMSDNGKPKPDTTVVTLLVSPEDAQKLTLASQGGRIQLALRNPLDLNPGVTVSTRETALYHLPTPAAPAPRTFVAAKRPVPPPAPSVYVVELIRGDKRDVSKF